jgi:RND family efflux transporter MFP subunit
MSKFPDQSVPMAAQQPTEHEHDPDQLTEISSETFFDEEEFDEEKTFKSWEKKRWPWIVGVICLIAGVGLSWRWWQSSPASRASSGNGQVNKPPAVNVQLATVSTKTVQESSVFVGTLQAPRFVTIKPQVEGRIKQIFIKEGDQVQQGQPIISLQNDDAQALLQQRVAAQQQANANLALLQAGARPEQIAQARATLAQAQARLQAAQSGAQPQEIAQAIAQIESAQSTLDLAKTRAKRYGELAKEGAVSQDQFEGYVKEQRSAASAVVVSQKRLEQLRRNRLSDINALSAVVEQQQQNLKQQQNGSRLEEVAQARSQVSQAAAQVRAAQVQLQYSKILAPFTGLVGNMPLKVGDYAAKGDALTTLTKNDSFELNLAIPLSRTPQLQAGLPVQLLDAKGQSIAVGAVNFIAPNATADSQTILAKANFTNADRRLLNGQSVQAKTIWDEHPGILIPVTAITRLGGKTFVFVAQSAPATTADRPALTAQQQPVELGAIEGANYQVMKGLKPGDKIVTSGLLSLTNGASIIVTPTAASNTQP